MNSEAIRLSEIGSCGQIAKQLHNELLQQQQSPASTSLSSDTQLGHKLDLPMVYNNLKVDNFRGTKRESFLVHKTRRQGLRDTLNKMSTMSLDDSSQNVDDVLSLPGLENSFKMIMKKKPVLDIHLADRVKRENHNNKKKHDHNNDQGTLSEKLHSAFNWTREYVITNENESLQVAQDWEGYSRNTSKPPLVEEIADLLLISSDDLRKFKLFDEDRLSSWLPPLRSLVNHLAYSDLLKMLAFSEWQQGNVEKCTYYISESHGTHLRSDMVDKHCLYFSRKEEHGHSNKEAKTSSSSSSNNTNNQQKEDEAVQSKVFNRQITDAVNFGKSIEDFQTGLNFIKYDWNIIQITALSFANNRFSCDIADWKETPALYLTCFQNLPGDKKRTSFTTFIKQPDVIQGASMQRGIIEEFNKVMIKNRHINDGYQGCRKKYWDIRAEHNRYLQDVLKAIEENWIHPWAFLLPGNIQDTAIQSKIIAKMTEVEELARKKLTTQDRIVVYKLIENYSSTVDQDTKASLGKFLTYVLNISPARGNRVSNLISSFASELDTTDLKRGPTILILDQELEQLPWDWLPSLRNTSVTRMPSMAATYTALKVMKYTRPRYPEIIDMTKCSFILNPDQTLKNVQARLQEYLKDRKQWTGVIGRKPTHQEVEDALQNMDVLIYCGHGSGVGFYPEFALQKILCRAAPILMGCSSGQYKYHGPKASSSSIMNSYMIAASPSMIGFLWEVTDVECDRVTVDLLQRWLPAVGLLPSFAQFDPHLNRPREKSLATAVLRARKAATQFLTEAALVNYGLPIETK